MRSGSAHRYLPVAFCAGLLLFGCATAPTGPAGEIAPADAAGEIRAEDPRFYGQGSGATAQAAEDAAAADAVRKAAEALLGPAGAIANRDTLDTFFASSTEISALLVDGSVELIELTEDNGTSAAVIRGRVDLSALLRQLQRAGIYGGEIGPETETVRLADESLPGWLEADADERGEAAAEPAARPGEDQVVSSDDLGRELISDRLELNDGERERLSRYLEELRFLVYFPSAGDAEISGAAVAAANAYLAEAGYEYRESRLADQIVINQQDTYREETAGNIDFLRWTAAKLHADLLLEISVEGRQLQMRVSVVDSGRRTGVIRERIDGSAGDGGSVGAIVRAVYASMPDAVAGGVEGFRDYLVEGIPYRVEFGNYSDAAHPGRLIELLEDEVRSVTLLERDAAGISYRINFLGTIQELEELIYDSADSSPDYDELRLAYQQSETLGFDVGR